MNQTIFFLRDTHAHVKYGRGMGKEKYGLGTLAQNLRILFEPISIRVIKFQV